MERQHGEWREEHPNYFGLRGERIWREGRGEGRTCMTKKEAYYANRGMARFCLTSQTGLTTILKDFYIEGFR